MSESKVPVGSVGYWAVMRLAQFLMIGITLLFLIAVGRLFYMAALILLLWFLLAVYLDSSVYGFADENGVHFRRYISMQFVSWAEIGRVSWFGKNILSIHMRAGNLLRREMNANSSSSRSILLNVVEEPELVRWLLVAKPSAADGLELMPWGTETMASRKMQAVLKILVPGYLWSDSDLVVDYRAFGTWLVTICRIESGRRRRGRRGFCGRRGR